MKKAIVTGGSSGLGRCIVEELTRQHFEVTNWSLETGVDVRSFGSVLVAAKQFDKVDVLVNCAGINRIDYLEQFSLRDWENVMDTNVKGIWHCVYALLQRLRDGTVLNIVSNAAHVPMTCSLAYNASKAAALMMTKQLARELGPRHNITVFSVSPNKLAGTGMSEYIDRRVQELRGWSAEKAREYQLAALPAHEETPPQAVAELIGFLLSSKDRHRFLQGVDLPYGGP